MDAIGIGYRLIDTAAAYGNEAAVGEAVKEAIGEERVTQPLDESLKKSGSAYFDLYLPHQALGDYFAAWRALEQAYREGKVKAIDVSNFS